MAETVVMKFGGTSVGSPERMSAVAQRIANHIANTGDRVVLVVSAMSGETNRLVGLAREVSGSEPADNEKEYNQLVASGEQASSALVSMALKKEGLKSTSLLAQHIGFKTSEVCGLNLIDNIDTDLLNRLLDRGEVPVVAGFQGVDNDGFVTTLGRGGSDTSAVAVAAALGSCRCIIYTDVDGVYSANPAVCPTAVKLEQLTYEEMLDLASSGAKVLQTRSVALAKKFNVPVEIRSSFSDEPGSIILEETSNMEHAVVTGVTSTPAQARITIRSIPDEPGSASKIFKAIADSGVVVDMIVQSYGHDNTSAISLTVCSAELDKALFTLKSLVSDSWSGATVESDSDVVKVSVVGEGMRTHSGVAAEVFEVLGRNSINIELITTSEIKISVAIQPKYAELAVRELHEHFIK